MLENRSFDHLLGYLRQPGYEIDGVMGVEYNFVNPADPNSAKVLISDDAPFVPDLNPSPGHDVRDVAIQMYGTPTPSGEPNNAGFAYDYGTITGVGQARAGEVMRCFRPQNLPVIATLAKSFAICDKWHSALPGPTWPNRLFLHCATSAGYTDNNPHHFTMRTIFENLTDLDKTWRVYFHDMPQSMMLSNLRNARYGRFFEHFDAFVRDCGSGNLPNYSFIEPRYFTVGAGRANDQHPDHGVLPGEQLIADVYNALRSSPQWNESLLLILWDEHGGFYDHVPPPTTVNPDDKTSPEFDFTRLGLRVPAVVVSPWISQGTIDHTLYDHSSLPATLKLLFGLPSFLTKRDAQANTFERLCSLDAVRTDLPQGLRPVAASLAQAYDSAVSALESQMAAPSDLQRCLVELANDLNPTEAKPQHEITTEFQAARHAYRATVKFLL